MFLEDYHRYVGQYSPGVKSIVYRSTKLKLEKQAEIVLRWEKSPGNYDLHFTETGLLFESFHFKNFRSEKIIYAYKGKPVQLININPETGFLNSTTKITYEKRKPIREVHNRGYSEEGINIRDYINYFYEGNSVRCEMRTTGENGWTKFTTLYDSQQRQIECKGVDSEGELITWDQFKYHSDGTKACEFSLDENGKLSGVTFIKQSIDQTYERKTLGTWSRYFYYC